MSYYYHFSGKVVPKARPRINYSQKKTYKCPDYRRWQNNMIRSIANQGLLPKLENVSVEIKFSGRHDRGKDLDNLAGAILDVLVGAGCLRDDNSKCVTSLKVSLDHSKDEPFTEVWIVSN